MTPEHTPARWRADLALLFIALIWGATFVLVKEALTEISTVFFLALRFSLAGICLLVLFRSALFRKGSGNIRRGWQGGLITGFFLWLGFLLQTVGLKYTTAGKSGFLTGIYIVLVPLFSGLLYRKMPQISEIAGILLAAAGMAFMMLPGVNMQMNRGDFLTVSCAVAFACHLLCLGYYSQRGQFEAVAVGQILAVALFSTLSLVIEPPRVQWTPTVLAAILITGIFATAIAFALQTWAQQFTTPTRTALILSAEPVFALLTAFVIAHEPLTSTIVFGAALILAGILLVELKPIPARGHP